MSIVSSLGQDQELVTAFVEATSGISQEEAARRVGVSQKTISTWRAGRFSALRYGTRDRLRAYLDGRTQAGVMEEDELSEPAQAVELLYASMRASIGKHPGIEKGFLLDQLDTAIDLAKEWGWETGRLHELRSRVERGDVG